MAPDTKPPQMLGEAPAHAASCPGAAGDPSHPQGPTWGTAGVIRTPQDGAAPRTTHTALSPGPTAPAAPPVQNGARWPLQALLCTAAMQAGSRNAPIHPAAPRGRAAASLRGRGRILGSSTPTAMAEAQAVRATPTCSSQLRAEHPARRGTSTGTQPDVLSRR